MSLQRLSIVHRILVKAILVDNIDDERYCLISSINLLYLSFTPYKACGAHCKLQVHFLTAYGTSHFSPKSGSGPSGLVLALTLAQNGVPVRVIEKDSTFHEGERGAGTQPRTLEVYNYLSIADDIFKEVQPIQNITIYKLPEGKEIIKVLPVSQPYPTTPSVPLSNPVVIGQYCTQRILRDHLARYNVIVECSTELVDFEQNEQGVTARLVKHEAGKGVEETIRVDYLIGADGSRSVVRKKLGLTFDGVTRPMEHLLVADIEIKGLSADSVHSWGDFTTRTVRLRPTKRPNVFALVGGGAEADVESALQGREGIIKFIEEATGRQDFEFGELRYSSEWRPNVRMVNKFGEGRVFVVGDAAHVHSPAGGQGLNSSVQDSFNLGWKLALVCKSVCPPSILEAYTAERLPVIKEMLERTTNLLDKVLKFRANGENTEGFVARPLILYQLGVHCRFSPLVVDEQPEFVEAKKADAYLDADPTVLFAGDRAPEAPALRVVARTDGAVAEAEETTLFKVYTPTRHTLLVFAKTVDDVHLRPIIHAMRAAHRSIVQIVVILPKGTSPTMPQAVEGVDLVVIDTLGHAADAYPPAAKGFPAFIVRPDGVVGAVVGGKEGINKYIKTIFVQ
ncbi:hypothetical protein EIP86_003818 [Pleurotus ostreatoroseus]|nr:hypothetical protein EIP86_003818 [Pleurotus ostreatoroseus]